MLVATALFGVGLWCLGPVPAGSFYDDGIYLTLGHSIAQGSGYHYLNLPGTPSATHYPPGYPALLAICWWLGSQLPQIVLFAKVLNAALMAVSAGLLAWLLIDGGVPVILAAAGVAAGVVAVPVLALSTIPFSEPLFLALLTGTVLVTRRALTLGTPGSGAWAGAGWGALFLVRTVGIVVFPVGLWLLYRRAGSRSAGSALATSLALALPWVIWSRVHAGEVPHVLSGSYGSYTGWYLESLSLEGAGLLLRIARHNLAALLRPMGVLLSPQGPAWLAWPVLPAGIVLLGLGGRALCRMAPWLIGSLVLYLMIVVVWPYPPDRFLWGIWPIVTAALALGYLELWRLHQKGRWRKVVGYALLLLGVIGSASYLYRQGLGVMHRAWEGPQRASAGSMEPAVEWVRTHAPAGAVIATVDDPLLHLYTGHPSVPASAWSAAEYGREQSVDTAVANLGTIVQVFHPAFVILPGGGTPEAFAAERMWRKEQRLELVDTLRGGGAVFRPLPADSVR